MNNIDIIEQIIANCKNSQTIVSLMMCQRQTYDENRAKKERTNHLIGNDFEMSMLSDIHIDPKHPIISKKFIESDRVRINYNRITLFDSNDELAYVLESDCNESLYPDLIRILKEYI